jgi:hypothetical protein
MKSSILLFAALLAFAGAARPETSGAFSLKIFEGYDFPKGAVVKSGSNADLSLTYQTRRIGMIGYLGAAKIKFFEAKPDVTRLTPREIDTWKDYEAGPAPGYYVIRARDGGVYLLHLESFENQGKAASYWKMNFRFEAVKAR